MSINRFRRLDLHEGPKQSRVRGRLGRHGEGFLFTGSLSVGRGLRRLGGLAAVGLWFLLWASGALGQVDASSGTVSSSGPDSREVLQVRGSRARYAEVGSTVPAFTVDALQIERAVPAVLTDALRGVGSIHMQTTTPGQGSPFLRGLTGSGLLNLVDGMRLNHAIYRSAPNPYLDLVDPYLTERIDVIRGPASVRHGSDAMGGVVSVVTRRPHFEQEDWDSAGRLVGLFSSADLARGIRAELETGRSGLGMRGGFTGLATGNLEGGGDTGRQRPSAFEAWGADASAVMALGDRQSLSADFQFMKQPDTPRYDELVAGYGQTEPSSLVFQYQPLERLFAHLSYEVEAPFRGARALDLDVSYQRIRDDRRTRPYPDPQNQYEFREHNTTELMGVVLSGVSEPTEAIQLNWGADAYLDWVSSTRTRRTVATNQVEAWSPRFPNGSRMDSYGVYLDGVAELLPTLSVNAGIRVSYFKTTLASRNLDPLIEAGETLENSDVTGALGLTWSPLADFKIMASYRRGFRAPNIFDLGTLGARPGNRYNIPSLGLRPEKINTYDLGFAYEGARVEFQVFAFYSSYDNKIASVLTGQQIGGPDGPFVVQSANEALMRLAGVEGSLEVLLSDRFSVVAEAFYTWGEQQVQGGPVQPADRIPPFQGRVGLAYRPRSWIWIEPYLRFAAEQDRLSQRDLQDPRINPDGTPGWVTLGIRSQWTWNEHVDWVLEVRNITNASYREHGSGYQAPGAGIATSLEISF